MENQHRNSWFPRVCCEQMLISIAMFECSGPSKVLIGDHLQLPPTLFLPNADELLVSRSLFERLCVLGTWEQQLVVEQGLSC